MIERVARAIGGDVWETCSDRMREQFRAQARMAINAMKEPTPEMISASIEANDRQTSGMTNAWIYGAMIDAALSEKAE